MSRAAKSGCLQPLPLTSGYGGYRQVLCANSFTSLAELSLHRAGKPALNYLVAEDRERVKGGEAACEALDVNSVFCYQPASSSCISMCFMLMYFFPPHWVEPRHMELNLSGGCHGIAIVMTAPITLPLFAAFITSSLCQLLRFCFQQAIYGGNRLAAMGQISDCRNGRSRTLCRWRFCNRNRLHGGRKNLYRRSGKRADKGLDSAGQNGQADR